MAAAAAALGYMAAAAECERKMLLLLVGSECLSENCLFCK
jgi:hypothetical protein